MKKIKYSLYYFMTLMIVIAGCVIPTPSRASAAVASEWQAGQIIDDGLFYNGNDMTLEQIQAFLNAKVPTCDTWGTQTSEYGGGTRAQYGASRGYPAPYICLKDYYENSTTHETNLTVNAGQLAPIPSGSLSAAQIIKNAASTYNISARALLVLLHKESSGPLTVDTWPFPTQYRNAMGYGCPDTAPCDPAYAGLYNQITNAASQLLRYKTYPTSYRHSAGHYNSVLYNPSSSCGASSVYIKTNATAGLYNYTPYQPNQAALNNLYGTGDACSAYGNRNFWRVYTDWFGSTQVPIACVGGEEPMSYVTRYYNPRTFMHFYSAYACDATFLKWIGYIPQEAAFNTTPSTAPWAVPVYRYYNPQTGLHNWSTQYLSPEELMASNTGYKQEAGIVFYVARADMPGVHPVKQFYNQKTYIHLLSVDPSQQIVDGLKSKSGFDLENTAFFVQ